MISILIDVNGVLKYQEDITFINIYVPNIGAPKYIKQLLTDLKEKLTVTQ